MKKIHTRRYELNRTRFDQWRESEGRTMKWVAAQIGVAADFLGRKCRGEKRFTLDQALRLSEVCGISVNELFEEAE